MGLTRRAFAGGLLAVLLANLSGCSMFESVFYELQPYRLNRWNRSDAMGDPEANYSVSDPIPSPDTSLAAPNATSFSATASPSDSGVSDGPSAEANNRSRPSALSTTASKCN